MKWVGPYLVDNLLDSFLIDGHPRPQEENSVYLVSLNGWNENPTEQCGPLYVGGNTGESARFRSRIGDLIADLFGFYCEKRGHHSGGKQLIKVN